MLLSPCNEAQLGLVISIQKGQNLLSQGINPDWSMLASPGLEVMGKGESGGAKRGCSGGTEELKPVTFYLLTRTGSN